MALDAARRLFTAAEYHRMAEAGVLTEADRVELIDGEILETSPIGPRHAASVKRLARIFIERLGNRAVVGVQDPIQLGERSEPEPDLALLSPRADLYAAAHPTAMDVLLLVEVAHTSVEYDRRIKIPLYARGGIQEVWLADPDRHHLAVYRDRVGNEGPRDNATPTGYGTVRIARPGETISPIAFPDLVIAIADADILG